MAAVPILLPELGAGRDVVRVSCWLVDLGDNVEEGDRVVEVIVPGVTFDVSAPISGILSRIEKLPDAPVASGDVLGWIE
jgi:pyruvate/2-oxoglutarate dehydrogenase complex dihydrolipoamide acyltransferase (E2) component